MAKIFKKNDEEKEAPKAEVKPEAPVSDSGCTVCGKEKAPGQTYVCAEHIRKN